MIREFAISLAVLNSSLLRTFWVKNSEYTGPDMEERAFNIARRAGSVELRETDSDTA